MPRGDFGGNRNTNGFDKNKENINRKGAPRKTISSVNKELEEKGVKEATAKDIKSCYLRLINIDLAELKLMVMDEKQPSMIRVVGKAILSGKGFDVIEKMLDRTIGKPTNYTDITSQGDKISVSVIEIGGSKISIEEK
jgi:hypothetical protein